MYFAYDEKGGEEAEEKYTWKSRQLYKWIYRNAPNFS